MILVRTRGKSEQTEKEVTRAGLEPVIVGVDTPLAIPGPVLYLRSYPGYCLTSYLSLVCLYFTSFCLIKKSINERLLELYVKYPGPDE